MCACSQKRGYSLCSLGLDRLSMCGIVVSIAQGGTGDAGTNTNEGNDLWETLVGLNTPRGAPRFTFVPDPCHPRILTKYVYLGPDYQGTVKLEVSPHVNLRMFASVLHLRGGQVTKQPHVDPTTGDVFCWNGEVGFVLLVGLDSNRGSDLAGVRRDEGRP